MVFEDLQWADEGLLDFIDEMLAWSRGRSIYIIALTRPELLDRRPTWGAGQRSFTSLGLEPLHDDEMSELLAGLVPGIPEAAVRAIVARAEGLPLYAVETIRMLLNDGRIETDGDAYRPVGDLTELAVPESLHALIAARMDALQPRERTLIQDASVLGLSFTMAALTAVTSEPDELEPVLRHLVQREVLTIDDDPRSPERGQYRFVQGLLREVAYGTLARRDRRDPPPGRGSLFRGARGTTSWRGCWPSTTSMRTVPSQRAKRGQPSRRRRASHSAPPRSERPPWDRPARPTATSPTHWRP